LGMARAVPIPTLPGADVTGWARIPTVV